MNERPALTKALEEETFRGFYYLKEELTAFCRANGLSAAGGKLELTERIAAFLSTGEVKPPQRLSKPKPVRTGPLSEESLIEDGFVCSEKHRAFFAEKIGKRFSFNVAFQKWLRANAGKPYAEAIEAYERLLAEKKKGASKIDSQFQYNTYIRAFFEDNPGKPLREAILCWNYKKAQKGLPVYARPDLTALESLSE